MPMTKAAQTCRQARDTASVRLYLTRVSAILHMRNLNQTMIDRNVNNNSLSSIDKKSNKNNNNTQTKSTLHKSALAQPVIQLL
jgi:chlorite dismutase